MVLGDVGANNIYEPAAASRWIVIVLLNTIRCDYPVPSRCTGAKVAVSGKLGVTPTPLVYRMGHLLFGTGGTGIIHWGVCHISGADGRLM